MLCPAPRPPSSAEGAPPDGRSAQGLRTLFGPGVIGGCGGAAGPLRAKQVRHPYADFPGALQAAAAAAPLRLPDLLRRPLAVGRGLEVRSFWPGLCDRI